MHAAWIILAILVITGFLLGNHKAAVLARSGKLHSRPRYHGVFIALWSLFPGLMVVTLFALFASWTIDTMILKDLHGTVDQTNAMEQSVLLNKVKLVAENKMTLNEDMGITMETVLRMQTLNRSADTLVTALVMGAGLLGFGYSWNRIHREFRARQEVEKMVRILLVAASSVSLFITLGIVLSLIFETLRFFASVPVTDFLFGLQWSPQTAIRADQVGGTGSFGAIPLFAGTL
ncbi:MAG TPA: phosphate ABC transporter permease subunit PstC, partial [Magnetococcales bacterium]|nr:phosphate ABC transporter permease subunit PstC [Magnetococcales bacterium]